MKSANKLRLLGMLACCLIGQLMYAQSPIVDDVDVQANEANLKMNTEIARSYFIEITGPNDYFTSYTVENATDVRLSPFKADGTSFENGSYSLQLTPVFKLTPEQEQSLLSLRAEGNTAAINRYMIDNQLPTSVDVFTYNFGIREGKFVAPNKHEGDMPPPTMFGKRTDFRSNDAIYASTNYYEVDVIPQTMDNSLSSEEDMQVFATDVIVQGSICVGFDCVNGESFGFDTERLKENNLRLHFDDTSVSASFPSNDWRLVANDTTNGGSNFFAIEDSTAGTVPFRVEAGAGNNALHVDATGGNVGMGTSTPVVELHITDGDSPTMRLEQNGSSGFTPQTWDVAGNETNFFVRDVTNGSKLPFKIRPGAPDNSLYIDSEGDIGLGTASPGTNALQVESGDVYVKAGNVGINVAPSGTYALEVTGRSYYTGGSMTVEDNLVVRGNARYFLTDQATFRDAGGAIAMKVDALNKRVGIGTDAPNHMLELTVDDAVKPGGGTWSAPSDRRLKTNIRDYEDGLAKVLAIRPVRYNYNGKMDMPTDKEFIGLIAQEIQQVAPYTVQITEGQEGKEGYMYVDGTPLTYMLINAVQDQQEIINGQDKRINELEAQLSEVAQLRKEVAALAQLLKAESSTNNADTQNQATDERK